MLYIESIILSITICTSAANIDPKTCKLTHLGLNFKGEVSKTSQRSQCQRWDHVHHLNTFNDEDFPDGSKTKAVNYCRNPTRDKDGPWCFTDGRSVVKQKCSVPLCSYNCQATGPGVEYAGTVSESKYKQCELWNQTWHKRKVKVPNRDDKYVTVGVTYLANRFPDRHIGKASNYCRNPDGSQGGPWCYIKTDEENVFMKSYCDVPVCDEKANEFISQQNSFYSHFISYKSTENNLSFAVRVWNPDHEHSASVKILLSALNIPTTTENLRTWATAVELTISNHGTGITIGNRSQFMEATSDILKATEYTNFVVSWKNNVLDLYTCKDSIYVETLADSLQLRDRNLSISHYSVSGDVASWSFIPPDDESCQEHTTFLPTPQFFWKLRQEDLKFYLDIFVRSFHSAIIFLMRDDPCHGYPRLSIRLGFPQSLIEVVYENSESVQSQITSTTLSTDYWSWTRLRIVLLGNELRLMTYNEGNLMPLVTTSQKIVGSLRWFSIGSNESLSHWTVYCEPGEIPPAYPPNCVLTANAIDYNGNQWVSQSGLPCLPWFAVEPRNYEDQTLQLNYCRNYKALNPGPWCYVQLEGRIQPEICNVRLCNAVICKKAGTANDYVGELSITRSNLTCKKWPRSFRKRHKHEMYPNDFFEGNFCRNPTRDVGGAWCFTTDPAIKKDLCDVKDCDKRESRIVITNQKGDSSYTYIIPKWRDSGENGGLHFALKRWDPSLPEGVVFNIFSPNKEKFLSLYIGAEYNEELILRYVDRTSNKNALLVQKLFPHIIPGGTWRLFTLKMPAGKIKLGYETRHYTIVDWEADRADMVFTPAFMNYESIGRDAVGVYFPNLECHVVNTSSALNSKIYPINWQRVDESSILTLYLRGTGIAIVQLVHFPSYIEDYLSLLIDNTTKRICIENNTIFGAVKLCCIKTSEDLISATKWSKYDIYCENNSLYVLRNKRQLMKCNAVIVYYYFSVASRLGWTLWAANCVPPDIDSPIQDGGWSPWSDWYCSDSCGKGIGYRTRRCTNPKPSIFGKLCSGSSGETGFCNDFPCGSISPLTYNLLRQNLQKKYFNIIAQEGDNVTFDSSTELIARIKTESPSSQINWMHNGAILDSNKDKYFCNDSLAVSVKNISTSDSGVFVCAVKSNAQVTTPIKVVVVSVEPKHADVIVYNGTSFELDCTSTLETIYADLWIKWYLNNELFAATDIAAIYFKNSLKIPVAVWNHSGIWKCVMEQTDLNMRWVVQIHKVLVVQKPSLLTRALQAYASIFVINLSECDRISKKRKIFIICISIVAVMVIIIAAYLVYRFKKKWFKYLRLHILFDKFKAPPVPPEFELKETPLDVDADYGRRILPPEFELKEKHLEIDAECGGGTPPPELELMEMPLDVDAECGGTTSDHVLLNTEKASIQSKIENASRPDQSNNDRPAKHKLLIKKATSKHELVNNKAIGTKVVPPRNRPKSPGFKFEIRKKDQKIDNKQTDLKPLLKATKKDKDKRKRKNQKRDKKQEKYAEPSTDEDSEQSDVKPLLKAKCSNKGKDKQIPRVQDDTTKIEITSDDSSVGCCTRNTCPYRHYYDEFDKDFNGEDDDVGFCIDETCYYNK